MEILPRVTLGESKIQRWPVDRSDDASDEAEASATRIILADDHPIVRRGIRGLLMEAGLSVVAEAEDGLTAVRLCEELLPDVLILDIGMPILNGIEVASRVHHLQPQPHVIILSMYSDESYLLKALEAKVRAYLLKSAADDDLLPALRAVAAGKPFFSAAVTSLLIGDYVRRLETSEEKRTSTALTTRETEVLQMLAEGHSNKDVAGTLCIGVSTVETHRANLMQKLNLHNTAEIVLYAVRKGMIR
jgi:two-component system response regulator NreC